MESPAGRTESQPTVLVAIEPRAYREVIGKTIEMLRPNVSVKVIESGMLDAELSRTNPVLVLCNGTVETSVDGLADGVPNRVIFYAAESDMGATLHVDGKQAKMDKVDLDDLLQIVDRVGSSIREDGEGPEGPEDREWRG